MLPHHVCSQHFGRYNFGLPHVFHVELTSLHSISNCPARTHGVVDKVFGWKVLQSEIIRRSQVQFQQKAQRLRTTANTYTWSCLTKLEQSSPEGSSRFCVGSRVRDETPEEGLLTYRPKRCEYNNEDEVNNPNILSDKNKAYENKKLKWFVSFLNMFTFIEWFLFNVT